MGLFDSIGGAIGGALFGPLGAIGGSILGGGLNGMVGGQGGPASGGYGQAIDQMNKSYSSYDPMIQQTKGSIGDYSTLLKGLGQGYTESPGMQAQSQLLNQKLASLGTGMSGASVGASYAPLVSQDYYNFFNRQMSQLSAQAPLMNMYQGALGAQTGIAGNLANLYTGRGTTEQGINAQNIQGLGKLAGSIDWGSLFGGGSSGGNMFSGGFNFGGLA